MKVCIPRQTTSGFFCQKTRSFWGEDFEARSFNMFAPEKWWEVGRRSGFLLGWYIFRGELLNFQRVPFFCLKFDSFSLSTRKDIYQSSNPCNRKLRSMTLWRGTFLAAFKTSFLVHSTVLFRLCLRTSFLCLLLVVEVHSCLNLVEHLKVSILFLTPILAIHPCYIIPIIKEARKHNVNPWNKEKKMPPFLNLPRLQHLTA